MLFTRDSFKRLWCICNYISLTCFLTACSGQAEEVSSLPDNEGIEAAAEDINAESMAGGIDIETTVENIDTEPADEDVDANLPAEDIEIVLGFAGDFNLDENWVTTRHMDSLSDGIHGCISPNLIDTMQSFDVFMLNNEYTYSLRGTPTSGKSYTFRANPDRVKILDELGVDVVLLANNHVGDYGEEALLDTLETLEADNMPYVGAGRNISEASRPWYYSVGDYKIAYCAASCAESYAARYWTKAATDTEPGILDCYDPDLFLESIRKAKAEADYVIANIHWGLEYSYYRDDFQKELGRMAIENGADIVIGSHPHVLQGIDFYNDKPVFYSLGNYWFNEKDLYSEIVYVSLILSGDHHGLSVKEYGLIPCTQYGLYTSSDSESQEWTDIIAFLNKISYNATVDNNGIIRPKEN